MRGRERERESRERTCVDELASATSRSGEEEEKERTCGMFTTQSCEIKQAVYKV